MIESKKIRKAGNGNVFKNLIKTVAILFGKLSEIFTESALRPIQSKSRDVRMFVSLSVRHTLETTLPKGLETSGRRAYR